ncbi:MAG: Stf0 family sulfotransferase [Pseudomonadota bacterium]
MKHRLACPDRHWDPPEKLLVIAGYYRSGTGYLASLLRSTERLGRPEEYFNVNHRPVSSFASDGEINFDAVFTFLRDAATTPNGICAIRLFPPEFRFLVRRADLSAWFPDIRFVWMQRADLLGQAISGAIAKETEVWQQTKDWPIDCHDVQFDSNRIGAFIRSIASAYQYWATFFAHNGITPLIMTYETVLKDPEAAVREIALFMDCDLSDAPAVSSDLIRQRDPQKSDFRRAYLGGRLSLAACDDSAKRVVPRTARNLYGLLSKQPI